MFCVSGARTALDAGAGPAVAVLMGTMTATFGGLIRDVVCTETPLHAQARDLRHGGRGRCRRGRRARPWAVATPLAAPAGLALAFAIRAVALVYGLSLPIYRPREARPR